MGLLEKRNPNATRRSVTLCAVGFGVFGFALGLVVLCTSDYPYWEWFVILPLITAVGAFVGGLMEWQLPE
jgi:hypothetical protein